MVGPPSGYKSGERYFCGLVTGFVPGCRLFYFYETLIIIYTPHTCGCYHRVCHLWPIAASLALNVAFATPADSFVALVQIWPFKIHLIGLTGHGAARL